MPGASYVCRGGEQVFSPPFQATNVDFFGFILPADVAAMQESICERCLNGPMGKSGAFKVAMPFVMLVFNNIGELVSTKPPYNMRGLFPEHEAAFWTLLLDEEQEKLFWFHPYILVDNAFALLMGREIYGFPKELGWFDIPTRHEDIGKLSAETLVVPKFGPDAHGTRLPLVQVERQGGATPQIRSVESMEVLGRTLLQTFADMPGLAGDIKLAAHELAALFALDIDMVFLKQFREARDPSLACYQGVTETTCKGTNVRSIVQYADPFLVTVPDYDSHPIRKDLGLPANPVTSVAAFWTNFDFWIGDCQDRWRADQ